MVWPHRPADADEHHARDFEIPLCSRSDVIVLWKAPWPMSPMMFELLNQVRGRGQSRTTEEPTALSIKAIKTIEMKIRPVIKAKIPTI